MISCLAVNSRPCDGAHAAGLALRVSTEQREDMKVQRHCRCLCSLALLLLLAACGGGDDGDSESSYDAAPPPAAPATLDFSAFDAALNAAIDEYNATPTGSSSPIRGASAAVVTKQGGLVHQQGYKAFASDRLYVIASAGKPLSAGVLMRLADQGVLDINTPVSTYLSDWGEHKQDVTVAQLLSNSSGLPSLEEIVLGVLTGDLQRFGPHICQYLPAGTLSDCGKSIYTDDNPDNNRPPDAVFRYGGSQWELAGAIAEHVSGKSWAELVNETYVVPCEVPSVGYTNPYGLRSDGGSPLSYPSYFHGNVEELPQTDNPSIEGGAYSTAPDYAQLLLMHLRDGQCGENVVLSPEAVKAMQTDRVAAYGGAVDVTDTSDAAGASDVGDTSLDESTGYGLGFWTGDGLVSSPGLYGTVPLLDLQREYGLVIMLEASGDVGRELTGKVKPTLDAIIEAAAL